VVSNPPKFVVSLLLGLAILLVQISGCKRSVLKPGVKEVQVSYSSIKPSVTISIGGTADWVLVTDSAVWVASTKPYDIVRIDPATNKIVARVRISDEACSGLAFGLTVCGFQSAGVNLLLFASTP